MTDDLVFEEPPPRTRRSEHFPILLALKAQVEKTGERQSVRIKVGLAEKDALNLANQVRLAASKIGDGFDVVYRFRPEDDAYGVWATYVPTPGDEPPVPTSDARAEAKAMIAEAMTTPRIPPSAIQSVGPERAGDHDGYDVPGFPIADDPVQSAIGGIR